MRHGLLKPSFIPPRPQRELRKVLEGGNIKLGTVVADILGTSGRAMLTALAAGANGPEEVAMLAHPRLRATREQLVATLQGYLTEHQRLMLRLQLDHVHH